jgi:hypothetical protein
MPGKRLRGVLHAGSIDCETPFFAFGRFYQEVGTPLIPASAGPTRRVFRSVPMSE